MKAIFHRDFEKDFKRLRVVEKQRTMERILLFAKEPFDSLLRNHPLKGKYQGHRSINIDGDLKAIYRLMGKGIAVFVAIGTHSQLYSL